MNGDQPGVTSAAPAEGAEAPIAQVQPTGSEAVTNPGNGQEQSVPYNRFQEVNDKAKAAEERAAKAEQEAESLRQQHSSNSTSDDEDDIDPSVRKLVTKIIEKQGYVKKNDVDSAVGAAEIRRQYNEDIVDLTSRYAKSGIPFVADDIRKFASESGINITSKASLDAAYKQMNFDKLTEAAKNAAITEFKENGDKNSAEKPGSTGAQAPQQPDVRGLKNRIHAARERISA